LSISSGSKLTVSAESHADTLHVVHQLLLVEMLGAVEGHVLSEVGQPLLVILLEHGARLDHQAELRSIPGLRVLAYVVAQSVPQCPDLDGGVRRQGLAQIDLGLLRGTLAGRYEGHPDQQGGGELALHGGVLLFGTGSRDHPELDKPVGLGIRIYFERQGSMHVAARKRQCPRAVRRCKLEKVPAFGNIQLPE
jgi:hypothetical protein